MRRRGDFAEPLHFKRHFGSDQSVWRDDEKERLCESGEVGQTFSAIALQFLIGGFGFL